MPRTRKNVRMAVPEDDAKIEEVNLESGFKELPDQN